MALSTYPELMAAVSDWVNRFDAASISRVPDFIALAEAGFNPDIARSTTLVGPFHLSTAAPTNALLTEFPSLYLNAAVFEAAKFAVDGERMSMFSAEALRAWNAVVSAYGKSRGVAKLAIDRGLRRVPGPTDGILGI